YVQWQVVTVSGQQVLGLLLSDKNGELTLRDANGRDHVIAAKDVDVKQKLTTSIMPDNLVKLMTEDDLTDLVEDLATLRDVTLGRGKWIELGPFDVDGQVVAPTAQSARLIFGGTNQVQILVNGVAVRNIEGQGRPWQETFPIQLKKGDNAIRLRFAP